MFKSSTMGKAVPIHDQTVAKVHIYTAITAIFLHFRIIIVSCVSYCNVSYKCTVIIRYPNEKK